MDMQTINLETKILALIGYSLRKVDELFAVIRDAMKTVSLGF